jgi:hypothetical protein
MRLSKKLLAILIPAITSCSSIQDRPSLDIDICAVLKRDGAVICRCSKPSGDMYSLTAEECANKRYNAISPDDAAELFDYLFNLSKSLRGCLEGK